MWNNLKDMPENYEITVTSIYEFGKSVGEYMSSEGECLATIEVGRFLLYLDLVGEASFTYHGKTYRQQDEINKKLSRLIREDSPEVEWKEKPELRLYLQMEDDSYSGFEIDIDCETLPNKLAIEVMMSRLLVDSLHVIDREEIVSDNGVVGVSHLLTVSEKRFLNILDQRMQLTATLPPGVSIVGATAIIYDKIAMNPDLANAVSMVDVLAVHREGNQVEVTTSWNSDNHAVNNDMRYIAGEW